MGYPQLGQMPWGPLFAYEWNQRKWPGVGSEDLELDLFLILPLRPAG